MSELMTIIKARKSIRAYQAKPLPKEVVKAVLEAARYAPTARNAQELEYRVITSQSLIEKLSAGIIVSMQKEGMPFMGPPGAKPDFFHGAPLLLIVTAPKDNYWAAVDSGLAVQNVMLYAASVDLGTCFIGMAKLIEKDKNLLKLLHIEDNMSIVAAVICGYPAENPPPKDKKLTAEYFE